MFSESKLPNALKVTILAFVLLAGFSYAMAWAPPGAVPPAGNVPAPINVGGSALDPQGVYQEKGGHLKVGGAFTAGYLQSLGNLLVPFGRVGIGTTDPPQAPLEVSSTVPGALKIVDTTEAAGKVLTSNAAGLATWQTPSSVTQWTTSGANIYYNGGNVGIGTANPSGSRLTIQQPGNGVAPFIVRSTDTTMRFAIYTRETGPNYTTLLLAPSGVPLALGAGGAEIVRITGGNVGIGTAYGDEATTRFEVRGTGNQITTIRSTNSNNARIRFRDTWTNTGIGYPELGGQADDLAFFTASNQRMTINSSGNVGIGTITPTSKLEVAGQVKITGGSPGEGKLLTSDGSGLASWQPKETQGLYGACQHLRDAYDGGYPRECGPAYAPAQCALNAGGTQSCGCPAGYSGVQTGTSKDRFISDPDGPYEQWDEYFSCYKN